MLVKLDNTDEGTGGREVLNVDLGAGVFAHAGSVSGTIARVPLSLTVADVGRFVVDARHDHRRR